MLAEAYIWDRYGVSVRVVQAVIDHCLSTATFLLGGLEEEDAGA